MPPPAAAAGHVDIKAHALTRRLYERNCGRKMAGNLSSIFQVSAAVSLLFEDGSRSIGRGWRKMPVLVLTGADLCWCWCWCWRWR